jgi:short-subunit dehydrogenase
MRGLRDSVVVITGASNGIGAATALAMAGRGAHLALMARNPNALGEVAERCRDRGAGVLAKTADVSDAAALDALAAETVHRFGRLDTWINNAAVNAFAPTEETPIHLWHQVIETNLLGTFHGIRAALPHLREAGSGLIINVSSVLGAVASPYQSAYVATKYAIRGLSDSVRQEVADVPGIRVSTVLPGPVDTPIYGSAANNTGRALKPMVPVIGAGRVAKAIVSCARRPRRELTVGMVPRPLLALKRFAPAAAERIMNRNVEKGQFGASPAPATTGELEGHSLDRASVSGGWSRRSRAVHRDSPWAASRGVQRELRR